MSPLSEWAICFALGFLAATTFSEILKELSKLHGFLLKFGLLYACERNVYNLMAWMKES